VIILSSEHLIHKKDISEPQKGISKGLENPQEYFGCILCSRETETLGSEMMDSEINFIPARKLSLKRRTIYPMGTLDLSEDSVATRKAIHKLS